MSVTVYHNPACGTSRSTLALLRALGFDPKVIEYMNDPPSEDELIELTRRMGVPLREVLREKGTPYAELDLGDPAKGDGFLLEAIRRHPILINRPIVVTSVGVKLCRPSDVVLDLLPSAGHADVTRDDGTSFLRDQHLDDLEELRVALEAAGLPTADLAEPNRTFFRYARLDGEVVAHAGFELLGPDVLLRSMTVVERFRRQGHGRNVLGLLMRRAHYQGARRAFVLTNQPEAREFFVANRFEVVARTSAPPAVLETRQAASLCPASATLLSRRITF